jgi:hypothetical protein
VSIGSYMGSPLFHFEWPAVATTTAEVEIYSCPPDMPQNFDLEPNQEHHFSASGNIQTVEWGPTRKTYTVRFSFLDEDDKDDLLNFFGRDSTAWTANWGGGALGQTGGTNFKMKTFRMTWADGASDDVRLVGDIKRNRVRGGRWELEFDVISDEA